MNQKDLDAMVALGCQEPGCTHTQHEGPMFIHSRCHIGAPMWASYEYGSGLLKLECSECKKTVAQVEVANDTR